MLDKLQQRIGYTFKNKNLLIEALTHKSYKQPYNNERLEFLGDAVLDIVVGEYLFFKFPKSDEGVLSKVRASLVNEESFTKLAHEINLGDYLFISNAEENNAGRKKSSLLSNAFEALMGAIYLEKGLVEVKRFAITLIEEFYPIIDMSTLCKDYKTTLQEVTQSEFGTTPMYKLVSSSGPDHLKEFVVAVYINDKFYADAKGKSKKIAQQLSAELTLKILEKINE